MILSVDILMEAIIYHAPLLNLLFYIKPFTKDVEKNVLDCGSEGKTPPLGLFQAILSNIMCPLNETSKCEFAF